MSNKLLQDSKGNVSSKRIAGISTLLTAVIMACVLFGFSIVKAIGDPDTAMSVINGMLMAGGALLGVGVFEKLGKK